MSNKDDDVGFAATQAMAPVSGPPPGHDAEETEATVQMTQDSVLAALERELGKQGGGAEDDGESTMLLDPDDIAAASQLAQDRPSPQPTPQRAPQPTPLRAPTPHPSSTPLPGMSPSYPPGMMQPGMQPGMMPPRPQRSVGLLVAIIVVGALIVGGIVFLFAFALT